MSTAPLLGKVVIVTGGATGIGLGAAVAIAGAGGSVIIGGRNKVAGEEAAHQVARQGSTVLFRQTDVSKAPECAALVRLAREHFGRLDGAFNNAGLQREFTALHATPIEDIDDVIDINLKGTLYMMKYEAELMLASGGGAIVNNSSIFGLKAMPNLAYYVASKHGIVGLTKAAALDYARSNIRVNAICPGPIKTPSYTRVTGGDDHMYDDGVPMHRIGSPEEVAAAVVWLLSAAASYVTGTMLSVDGGMSAA
ncbi:glucose 1-dehydrogenase [Actimicrobium antarcticum]|uniref:SDR family oxidoreductase n=1 Tax=Actimicrobium antarcticum TaxID=1051899 RepID=A0ABP7SY78_9BURK